MNGPSENSPAPFAPVMTTLGSAPMQPLMFQPDSADGGHNNLHLATLLAQHHRLPFPPFASQKTASMQMSLALQECTASLQDVYWQRNAIFSAQSGAHGPISKPTQPAALDAALDRSRGQLLNSIKNLQERFAVIQSDHLGQSGACSSGSESESSSLGQRATG
jgi:hypothetical protein